MSIEYRAETGVIVAPPDDMDRLLRAAAAGTLEDDVEHRHLAATLAPIRDPVCEIRIDHGPRVCHAWVARKTAVLVMPQSDARVRVVGVPTEFVPEALARLVELGPRPRPEAAVPLELTAGDLARMLAVHERPARRPARLGRDAAEAAALDAIAAGTKAHWRMECRFGEDGGRTPDVLDTSAGMWLVRPDGDRVQLVPATPTTVFTALVTLLPDDDELR
jgi:hypothetical protein